jgi:hypothetical protein
MAVAVSHGRVKEEKRDVYIQFVIDRYIAVGHKLHTALTSYQNF